MSSLLDVIGGPAAVEVAVGILYKKISADPAINRFFFDVDMAAQHRKMKHFLTLLLSGAAHNAEAYMRSAHANAVAQGLNDGHFDRVAGHLQATLEELGVPADVVAEIISAAASLRDPVLGRVPDVARHA